MLVSERVPSTPSVHLMQDRWCVLSSSLEDRVLAYSHDEGLRPGDIVPAELELALSSELAAQHCVRRLARSRSSESCRASKERGAQSARST